MCEKTGNSIVAHSLAPMQAPHCSKVKHLHRAMCLIPTGRLNLTRWPCACFSIATHKKAVSLPFKS